MYPLFFMIAWQNNHFVAVLT